jgi:hypothetical protein
LNNNNRDAIFHNAQVEEQLANEKHAEALARSPEDWQRIVSSKDVQMTQRDNEIAKLRAEKEALIEQLKVAKYALAEAKKKARKEAKRIQTSVDAEEAEQHKDAVGIKRLKRGRGH